MRIWHRLLTCLVIAVVAAISVNGIAMAANGLGHQTHCVDAMGESSHDTTAEHAHDHDDLVAHHATPDHDHESCMMHACPALSVDSIGFGEQTDIFLTNLSWPEQPPLALERADGLKRPPKT